MKIDLRIALICGNILLWLLPGQVFSAQYTIGVRAHNGIAAAIKKWKPTVDYLNQRIPDHTFTLMPVVQLTELTQRTGKGDFDFILTNPSSYAENNILHGASRILTLINKRQNSPQTHFGSVIFTLNNTPGIETLEDIEGKRLIAVSRHAFGGWTMSLREILRHDIDISKIKLQFAGGIQNEVVFSILRKEADVGVVRTDQLERMAAEGKIRLTDFKILNPKSTPGFPFLHSTELYPEWPFSRLPHVPDDVAQQVVIALLNIKPENPAAVAGKYAGWTVPLSYQSVIALMQELKLGPYKEQQQITLRQTLAAYQEWIILFSALFLIACFISIYVLRINRKLHQTRNKLQLARDQLENRVNITESRERIILDTVSDAIVTIDNQGIITSSNRAANDMFQTTTGELFGKPLSWLAGEEEDTFNQCQDWHTHPELRLATNSKHPIIVRRKDSPPFPVSADFEPLQTGGFAGVIRDISERMRIDKMKNEFISTVSHELRTPLTSIKGALGLFNARTMEALPEQARELLIIANNNTERLLLLINDILDIQKIESDDIVFKFEPGDLNEVVEKCVLENVGFAQQHKTRFVITERSEQSTAIFDRDRIVQVINNLLSNAAKFSPAGKDVEISTFSSNGTVRLEVKDFGPGIPIEFQPKLFEKFTQSDSSDTRQVGGTGLGLSIARSIIERHNGHIGFESRLGVGTTFYFELNAISAKQGLENPGDKQQVSHALILEDDPDVANLLSISLARANFRCDIAHTTEEAWTLLEQARYRYQFITVDLMLPEQSGEQFINELRSKPQSREIPVIIISAKADIVRQELHGNAFEVLDWLQKPIDQTRLLQAVESTRPDKQGHTRILHIEDEDDIRDIVRSTLTSTTNIIQAQTLTEARQLLQQNQFDIVILDIGLPDGSGLSLLAEIDQINPAPAVVVFSAYDLPENYAEQVNAVLVKSRTDTFTLNKVVNAILDRQNQKSA